MSIRTCKNIFSCLLFFVVTSSCVKNESHYYPDNETTGVSIFSNTGNNVFSCVVDGEPWRTVNRTVGGLGPSNYELRISKQYFDSLTDQLSFNWYGYFSNDQNDLGSIMLVISVKKNFGFADFSALQGKRLVLDGINNYVSLQASNNLQGQGPGVVYFNQASLDSGGTGGLTGQLSGLIEANFGSFQLTSGRFDHSLAGIPVFFGN